MQIVRAMTAPATPAVPAPAGLPEGVRVAGEMLVRLTPDAGTKVAALAAREQQGDFLRIAITGGGCNGLSYKLRFAAEPRDRKSTRLNSSH